MTLRIDRYEVQKLIGQGAMGKVFLATDPKIGRQVAIKVLATDGADAQMQQRFRLEARAIAALKHPNIVELYDYSGEEAPDLFLVMEYIDGHSLDAFVRHNGVMSEPTALCIVHELCLALAHAHRLQIVHRDLKPENVLLAQGRVVLTDFGIVKALTTSASLGVSRVRTRTQVLGTPGFMAPEQFAGKQIDARTDIFAVGALLYCLATERVPFEGESVDGVYNALKRGKYEDPRKYNELLSPGLCAVIERCLAPRPKDRYANADELRTQVLSLLGSHGVTEVRQELVLYEQNPSGYAIEQRERSVEVLLRDLKVALKDRDEDMAKSIIGWVKSLAPLDRRLLAITGVGPDGRPRPLVEARSRPWLFGVVGVALGLTLGLVSATIFDLRPLLPADWRHGIAVAREWIDP